MYLSRFTKHIRLESDGGYLPDLHFKIANAVIQNNHKEFIKLSKNSNVNLCCLNFVLFTDAASNDNVFALTYLLNTAYKKLTSNVQRYIYQSCMYNAIIKHSNNVVLLLTKQYYELNGNRITWCSCFRGNVMCKCNEWEFGYPCICFSLILGGCDRTLKDMLLKVPVSKLLLIHFALKELTKDVLEYIIGFM